MNSAPEQDIETSVAKKLSDSGRCQGCVYRTVPLGYLIKKIVNQQLTSSFAPVLRFTLLGLENLTTGFNDAAGHDSVSRARVYDYTLDAGQLFHAAI